MDQKTRQERARNKMLARKNADGLAANQLQPRGLGRKNKPSDSFPNRQCDYRVGGTEVLLRRKRKNPSPLQSPYYFLPMVVGGQRCIKNELMKGRCLEHLASTYEKEQEDN